MPSKISVIVVAHNCARLIDNLLKSLPWDLVQKAIIVDSGSHASELTELHRILKKFPGSKLKSIQENIGFARGVNIGFESLQLQDDELLMIINPDCVVNRAAVLGSMNVLNAGVVDIVSPRIRTQSASGHNRDWFNGGSILKGPGLLVMRRPRFSGSKSENSDEVVLTDFISGAFMGMEARVFRQLSGLREHYFLYWEDADFCQRADSLGYRLGLLLGHEIFHHVGGSSSRNGKRSLTFFYFFHRNRLLFFRASNQTWSPWKGTAFVGTVALFLRYLFSAKEPVRALRVSLSGIRDGCRGNIPGKTEVPTTYMEQRMRADDG